MRMRKKKKAKHAKGHHPGTKTTQFKAATQCNRCGIPLTPENKRDGKCVDCKKLLQREQVALYNQRHPDRLAATRKATEAKRVMTPARREATRLLTKRWIENNPVRAALGHTIRQQRRRTRCRDNGRGISLQEWREQLEVFNRTCAYCLRDDVPMTLDHVIPVSRDGPHEIENAVPACRACNEKKHARGPLVMLNTG